MDTNRLQPGDIVQHFKGNMYQILTFGTHSETEELVVIYQQLYWPYNFFVRPYDMFMSEVDKVKYPDTKQKYRFEKIKIEHNESKNSFR